MNSSLLLGAWFFASTLLSAMTHADTVRVAAASNFIAPMKNLVDVFQASTTHSIKVSHGSSGKLFAQISQGAPFDLFLSADQDKPERLLSNGLAISGTDFRYARGQLALLSAHARQIKKHPPDIINKKALSIDLLKQLKSAGFNRLAIANPKLAPYGASAQQFLIAQGLLDAVKDKLVFGENIAQTYQFVYSGSADLGLVAHSQLKEGDLYTLLPLEQYPAISQQAVLLKHGQDKIAAKEFMHFLQSAKARVIIRSYGYHTF